MKDKDNFNFMPWNKLSQVPQTMSTGNWFPFLNLQIKQNGNENA